MARLQQIGFNLTLLSLVLSLFYLSIDEIALILGRILLLSFLMAIVTVVYTYRQPSFFKSPVFTGVKVSLMLGLAASTAVIATGRSEVIVRWLCKLHVSACNPLLVTTLPMPLAMLAVAAGLVGLILTAIVFRATLIFGD